MTRKKSTLYSYRIQLVHIILFTLFGIAGVIITYWVMQPSRYMSGDQYLSPTYGWPLGWRTISTPHPRYRNTGLKTKTNISVPKLLFNWFLWGLLSIPLWIAINELKMKKRRSLNKCVACGYQLSGLIEPRCPECGTEFDPKRLTTNNNTEDTST